MELESHSSMLFKTSEPTLESMPIQGQFVVVDPTYDKLNIVHHFYEVNLHVEEYDKGKNFQPTTLPQLCVIPSHWVSPHCCVVLQEATLKTVSSYGPDF